MFELDNISFEIDGRKIFDNFSLKIEKNESVVLLGINGCGKSTLLRLLAGLIYPDSGSIKFNKELISENRLKAKEFSTYFRKNIGLLFQQVDAMLFNPTVYDEIAFGLRQLGGENVDDKVRYFAKLTGVEEFLKAVPFRLSGGEKQKVALASILCVNPTVLLLDEPTSSLDPATIGWLVDFLNDLKLTTITTTHNLSIASELGDRAIVLGKGGKIFYDGSSEKLLNNKEILSSAGLLHKHKHKHDGAEHTHYHLHEW